MPPVRKPPAGGEPPAGAPDVPEAEYGPRKLIRPSLAEIRHNHGAARGPARKGGPPEATNAEAFYYLKQMNAKTPMVVVLNDGEELHGVIEWYDKGAIKVNRVGAPNLLVMKPCVKYMYKAEELTGKKEEADDTDD